MYKEHIFDPLQQPDLSKTINFHQFKEKILRTSFDIFPQHRTLSENIKEELSNNAKISKNIIVEKFMNPIPQDKTSYHLGYMDYLLKAWYCDCGIEVGPWHIWNIILHNVCELVNNEPEKYRSIFTKSDEKIEIIMFNEFNIKKFIDNLNPYLPTNIENFVVEFDSQPEGYQEAMYGLFAKMVKEYYSGMVLGCSIPKVRILGNRDEWMKLLSATNELRKIINDKYLDSTYTTVEKMVNSLDDETYWNKFFFVEDCGSGSQKFVGGHILGLFDQEIDVEMIPKMISRFPFITQDTITNDFTQMYYLSGVMYSNLDDDGFLIPEYHNNVIIQDASSYMLTEYDITKKSIILELLNRMEKYSEYQSNHGEIKHYRILRKFFWWGIIDKDDENAQNKRITPIDFDEFMDKYKNYLDNALDANPKYSSLCDEINYHNNIIDKMHVENKTYIQVLNDLRLEKLKDKYHFWWKNYGTYTTYEERPNISVEEYNDLLKFQSDDVNYIVANIDTINEYIKEGNFEVMLKIMYMRNRDIMQLFIAKFRVDPYKFGEDDDNNNTYEELLHAIFTHCNRQINHLRQTFCVKFLEELFDDEQKEIIYGIYCDKLKKTIIKEINFCKENNWNFQEKYKDDRLGICYSCVLIKSYCELVKIDNNWENVVNEVFKENGFDFEY